MSKIQLNIRQKTQAESLGDLRNQAVYLHHLIYENQNATNSITQTLYSFIWKWVWFAWKWTCIRNTFSHEWFRTKTHLRRGKRQRGNDLLTWKSVIVISPSANDRSSFWNIIHVPMLKISYNYSSQLTPKIKLRFLFYTANHCINWLIVYMKFRYFSSAFPSSGFQWTIQASRQEVKMLDYIFQDLSVAH